MKSYICTVLQESQPAAPSENGKNDAQSPGCNPTQMILLMVPMFLLMYFMMIRPQRRQQKERETMLAAIKKNDHIILQSGIYAIVDKVKDNELIVKIDEKSDVRIRVARSAIAGVEKKASEEEDASKE